MVRRSPSRPIRLALVLATVTATSVAAHAAPEMSAKPGSTIQKKPIEVGVHRAPPALAPTTPLRAGLGDLVTLTGSGFTTHDGSLPFVTFGIGGARVRAESVAANGASLVFRVPNNARSGHVFVSTGVPDATPSRRQIAVHPVLRWPADFFTNGLGRGLRIDMVDLKLQTGPGKQSSCRDAPPRTRDRDRGGLRGERQACGLRLDAAGRDVPAELMDALKIRETVVASVKAQGKRGLEQAGLTTAIAGQLNKFLRDVRFPQPASVAAGPNDQLVVEGPVVN